MTTSKLSIAIAIAIAIAFAVGAWVGHEWKESRVFASEDRVHSYLNGQLTNPLLECTEASEALSIGDRASIEESVTEYVQSATRQGVVSDVAIYFRDLNNGPWFGINERALFTPGSLLKLPLAMSYYWVQQRQHETLDKNLEFMGTPAQLAVEENFGSDAPLAPGVYTIRDLIAYMLKESSNDAAEVLAAEAEEAQIFRTYKDLGIMLPSFGKDYEIDVKTFGAFFRVLYNASYVGQPASEELLTTLTHATFTDGLVAGVSSSVKVAHKFGTRVVPGVAGGRQLHDCGIIYAPKTPYILCVMTRGNSSKNLSYFIAQVSKRVYEGVTK